MGQRKFDPEFFLLFEECKEYLNEFHKLSVESSMAKSYDSPLAEEEAHDVACYHMKMGIVTDLLRALEERKFGKREEVKMLLRLAQRLLPKKSASQEKEKVSVH